MKVGFVGLGKMGTGMARNLLRAGHELTVYNRTPQKAEALTGEGARVADSPAEAAHGNDAVFTMLSDDHAAFEASSGANSVGEGLAADAIHISSSTISTSFSRRMAQEHGARKQGYVAAPVFGRPEAAEGKKLIVIAAGPADLVKRCQPLFEAIGRRTFVVSDQPWQANAVKLCGNFMIASMVESFSEAFTTIAKSGMERSAFLEIMSELFGSPVYRTYGRSIVERNYDTDAGFALQLALKDVRLVLELAEQVGAPMPAASLVRDHLLSAVANGQGNQDWSSLELVSARAAGLDTSVKSASA